MKESPREPNAYVNLVTGGVIRDGTLPDNISVTEQGVLLVVRRTQSIKKESGQVAG